MNQPLRNLIQSEFYLAKDILYLNHAAIAPWPNRTAEAVKNLPGKFSAEIKKLSTVD